MGGTGKNQTLNSGPKFYPIFDKVPKLARQKITQRLGTPQLPNCQQNRNIQEPD